MSELAWVLAIKIDSTTVATSSADAGEQIAAVDLGSNSFHLIISQRQGDRWQPLDRIKETVRLARGLQTNGQLAATTKKNALACLARFNQMLRGLRSDQVRVVGTHTLRKLRHSKQFLKKSQQALGHRIEIISGREEARLIYLGVAYSLEPSAGNRLVIDIGGGSTEIITGQGYKPKLIESLGIGCVQVSKYYFDDILSLSRFQKAEQMAIQQVSEHQTAFQSEGWDTVVGASGTIQAILALGQHLGVFTYEVTKNALDEVIKAVLAVQSATQLTAALHVAPERAAILPGGLAILSALFKSLQVDTMAVSDGALREGLLQDLMGRQSQRDTRERTIANIAERYHVDWQHGQQVQQTAIALLEQVKVAWRLEHNHYEQLLRWGSLTHELGLDIAHHHHHKHGSYLLRYMDLPGFSMADQEQLAVLVKAHRHKLSIQQFQGAEATGLIMRLALLLRLAVLMHRNRGLAEAPKLGAKAIRQALVLRLPEGWLQEHPLTALDLNQEIALWRQIDFTLTIQ